MVEAGENPGRAAQPRRAIVPGRLPNRAGLPQIHLRLTSSRPAHVTILTSRIKASTTWSCAQGNATAQPLALGHNLVLVRARRANSAQESALATARSVRRPLPERGAREFDRVETEFAARAAAPGGDAEDDATTAELDLASLCLLEQLSGAGQSVDDRDRLLRAAARTADLSLPPTRGHAGRRPCFASRMRVSSLRASAFPSLAACSISPSVG